MAEMLLHGQVVGQSSRGDLQLFGTQCCIVWCSQAEVKIHIADAQNKPADLHRMHLMPVC